MNSIRHHAASVPDDHPVRGVPGVHGQQYVEPGQAVHPTNMSRGTLFIQTFVVSKQASKGIRQWPINLGTSPMMILKVTPFVDYKVLRRLDTQLNEQTNQN